MAEWLPEWITNDKGVYHNCLLLRPNITKFTERGVPIGGGIQASFELQEGVDDNPMWSNEAGFLSGRLFDYMRPHANQGVQTDVKLFEVDCENPEGAQFYKQSLAVYIKTDCQYTEYFGYQRTVYYYTIDRISRLEYATPVAVPTETVLISGGSAGGTYYEYTGDVPLVGLRGDSMLCGFSKGMYDGVLYAGAYFYTDSYYDNNNLHLYRYGFLGIPASVLDEEFGGEFLPEETDDPTEDPDPGGDGGDDGPGGGGEHDKHQDPIDEPDLPPLSATAAGFVTMYKLYETSMQTFAQKMFDPDVWSAIKQLFADPMDFICGILILPFSPHTSRSARPILQQVPPIAWDYFYPVIEQQYHIVDCGTIEVPQYYKTALDYSPYTKDTIYLPYIGYRELNADEVQGKTLKIKYHVDVMTGDCVANIIRPTVSGMTPMNQVIAQFSGNCGVHVPFGRQSFDNAIAASVQLISGVGNLAGGIAMMAGGSGGLASGGKQLAEGMIASSVAGIGVGAVNGSKAHVERAGVMGSSAGYMGVQTPYLIRQIPNQSLPDKGYYRRLNGYPCNEAGKLSDFSGYTAIESIELSGIGATQEEKTEILNMMLGGVIV